MSSNNPVVKGFKQDMFELVNNPGLSFLNVLPKNFLECKFFCSNRIGVILLTVIFPKKVDSCG